VQPDDHDQDDPRQRQDRDCRKQRPEQAHAGMLVERQVIGSW
jgi:hypothetical protein